MRKIFIILITLSAITFLSFSKKPDTPSLVDLSLQDLMKLKISTTSKIKETIENSPASVVILTREEIRKYGYKSLADIIQNIPGFYMINDYYWLGSENFGVRGFFTPGVLNDFVILINGVNMIGDAYSDYSLSKINIPVEAIDRIEIVRGPMSIVYGSGAFLGAINIITNKEKISFASLSYGSCEYNKIFVRFFNGNKNTKININFSSYGDNGISVPYKKFTDNTFFLEKFGLSENSMTENVLKYRKSFIMSSGKYKNLYFDFSYNNTRKGVFDGFPSPPPGTFLNNAYLTLHLKYQNKIKKNIKTVLKATYLYDSFYWEYSFSKRELYATNYNNTLSYELETNLLYLPSKKIEFILGAVRHTIFYIFKTYDYPVFNILYENTKFTTDENINYTGIFFQLNYKANKKIFFSTGLRAERINKYKIKVLTSCGSNFCSQKKGEFEDDKIKLIPRLALIFKPSDFQSLKFIYGKAIKQPSLIQNVNQITTGYPTLSPAYIETFEFNYLYSPSKKALLSFSLYLNKIKDLIVKRNIYDPETNRWILHSTNSGKMETKGAELGIKLKPMKNINLNLNFTYQKTKNIEKGFKNIKPAYAPEQLAYLKADYTIGNISLAIIGRYVSKMFTLWDPAFVGDQNSIHRGRIGKPVSPYFTLDFNLRLENFPVKKFFTNIHTYNILNKEIRFPTTPGNSWAVLGTLDYGRTIIFSLGRYLK